MFRQWHKFHPFFDVPTDNKLAGGGLPAGTGKEDVIQFLGMDDEPPITLDKDKPAKTKDTKDKDEEDEDIEAKPEETDELAELEEELEPPTEEQLELVTPVRRKEILKKYPNLFKEFPYLEKAYYREQQFTELLPTIDDAREAVDKSKTLDAFEEDLHDGNIANMLLAAKKHGGEAFSKIADNYLGVLAEVDEKAYHHVVGNTIKHTIMSMVAEGRRSQNEALQSAAAILNQFVFGSSDFVAPTKLTKDSSGKDDKETKLSEREKSINKKLFDNAKGDLDSRVTNAYKATIEANIDPKESMTEYVRKTASREALEEITTLMTKDSRFNVLVDKLWAKAVEEDFSKSSLDRIRTAFVSKAKTLLPAVIKKARIEALKGMGKRVSTDKEDTEETTPRRGPVREKPRSDDSGRNKGGIPDGMSTLDFLMKED